MKRSLATLVFVCALTPPAFAQFWDSSSQETFRWRGKVDGVDDILVQGSQVKIEHVSAMPIQNQQYKFSTPLPFAEVDLSLTQIKGRGTVRILEQPTKRNQFTAVIRVDDQDHSGASDYEFELSWSRKEDKDRDAYDAVFRWRGKVDIGCTIEIRGRSHQVKDEGGSGTQERNASFTEALPSSGVPVSVTKRKGRGKVELVQSPNAGNGFTAVVRIQDDKGGADDYDFELSWPKQ